MEDCLAPTLKRPHPPTELTSWLILESKKLRPALSAFSCPPDSTHATEPDRQKALGDLGETNSQDFSFELTPPLRLAPTRTGQPEVGVSQLDISQVVSQAGVSRAGVSHTTVTASIIEATVPSPESPNPCAGLGLGPHQPSFPAVPQIVHRKISRSVFADPFEEYAEDRWQRFHPSLSQNNVDQTLENAHPYQMEEKAPQWRMWKKSQLNDPQESSLNIQANMVPLVALDPGNSFLFPIGEEPQENAMDTTPRAVPLVEVKYPGNQLLEALDPEVRDLLLGPLICCGWLFGL